MKKRIKRLLGGLLLLLCLGLTVGAGSLSATSTSSGSLDHFQEQNNFNADTFRDVGTEDWFYDEVESVYRYGLMIGVSSDMFSPYKEVTLAESITLAARLHSVYYTGSCTLENGTPWYQNYLDYAKSVDIITEEYDDYNQPATRSEFATMLFSAFPTDAFREINQISDNAIPDVASNASYAAGVYTLYRAGVLTGTDADGTFLPDKSINRSEVAAIVSRMVDENLRVANITTSQETNLNAQDNASTSPSWKDDSSLGIDWELAEENGLSAEDLVDMANETETLVPTFYIETVKVSAEDSRVAVPIMVKNNPGITSIAMWLSYDERLTLNDIEYQSDFGGQTMSPEKMSNPIKLIWVSPFENVEQDGVFATAYFDLPSRAAEGIYQISISYSEDDVYNLSEQSIVFDVQNGGIIVSD